MKFLHYSDREEPELKRLFESCDVLVTTGDLSLMDFSSIEEIVKTKPAFGVYGNHCNPGYMDKLGIIDLHLNTIEFNGFIMGGYQGSPRYKPGGGPQFTEEEALKDLDDYPHVDILLLHAAPFGLLDTPGDPVHTGSKAVRDYVDRTSPRFIFCGHDSPNLEMEYGETQIFRTHKARIIEI